MDTLEAEVALKDIVLDESYGRVPSAKKIDDMANSWDGEAAGVLYLSLRKDGAYACVDGWHRVLAGRKAGVKTLPARVYIDKTLAEEAKLFDDMNRRRLKPNPNETFKARLAYREPVAVEINYLVRSQGLDIALDRSGHNGTIKGVASLESAHAILGEKPFLDMLGLLRDGLGRGQGAFQGPAIYGMAHFLKRYPDVRHPRVVETLKAVGYRGLMASARSMKASMGLSQALGTVWGMALRDYYNKNLRSGRLPEWVGTVYGPGTKERMRRERENGA